MLLAKMGQKYVTYITCKNAKKKTPAWRNVVIRASMREDYPRQTVLLIIGGYRSYVQKSIYNVYYTFIRSVIRYVQNKLSDLSVNIG